MTTVGSLDALDQLRPVVDVVPAAFVAVDGDGRVILWNPAAERLFGLRADDVAGRPDPTLPGGTETADSVPHEVTRVRADGALVTVTAVHHPLRDGRLTVYADGGERRRLELELVVRAKQQAAVVHHYLAGLPYAEVGAALGTSPEAARRSAADGIAALRAALSPAADSARPTSRPRPRKR